MELKFGKNDYPYELNYSSVRFLDARADTGKIGFAMAGDNEYHRLVFPKPTAEYFNTILEPQLLQGYDSARGYYNKGEILFVLNDFWMSEINVKAEFGKSLLTGDIDNLTYCYVNTKCYLATGEKYLLLGQIDTVISIQKWIMNCANAVIKKTVNYLLLKADSMITIAPKRTTELTYGELTSEIAASYQYPVLKTPLKKGIYLVYQDFLANTPVTDEFTVKEDKNKETIICASLPDSITKRAWGYCDGSKAYIHLNKKYFTLLPSQNTFEFIGPRKFTSLYPTKEKEPATDEKILSTAIIVFMVGVMGPSSLLFLAGGDDKIMKELVPYQLNIKTGKVYY